MELVVGDWYIVQRIHPGDYYEHLYGERVQYIGKAFFASNVAEVRPLGEEVATHVWAMDLLPYNPVNNEDGAFYLKKEESL